MPPRVVQRKVSVPRFFAGRIPDIVDVFPVDATGVRIDENIACEVFDGGLDFCFPRNSILTRFAYATHLPLAGLISIHRNLLLNTSEDMMPVKFEQDEILNLLKGLAKNSDKVQVAKAEGNPDIYEIRDCKQDFAILLFRSELLRYGQANNPEKRATVSKLN